VLQHVASHGFALVPLPLPLLSGETYLFHAGHLWQLEPFMPGRGDYAAQPSRQRLTNALSALARFHQAALDFPQREATSGSSHGMLERIERLERFKAGGLVRLRSRIDTSYEPELAALAIDCCELARQVIPGLADEVASLTRVKVPQQPVIGDVWHDNVLFEGDAVSGIVDFGATRIDNVARDIARLLGGMAADNRDDWQHGLAAYETIRPLSPTEQQFVTMFDRCNVALSGLNWATWIYDEHREFDDLAAVRGRLEHFVSRLRHLVS
jgi:homoserine kinase type II